MPFFVDNFSRLSGSQMQVSLQSSPLCRDWIWAQNDIRLFTEDSSSHGHSVSTIFHGFMIPNLKMPDKSPLILRLFRNLKILYFKEILGNTRTIKSNVANSVFFSQLTFQQTGDDFVAIEEMIRKQQPCSVNVTWIVQPCASKRRYLTRGTLV